MRGVREGRREAGVGIGGSHGARVREEGRVVSRFNMMGRGVGSSFFYSGKVILLGLLEQQVLCFTRERRLINLQEVRQGRLELGGVVKRVNLG